MMRTSNGAATSASNRLLLLSRATDGEKPLDLRPYLNYTTPKQNTFQVAQPVDFTTVDTNIIMPSTTKDTSATPDAVLVNTEQDVEKQRLSADEDNADKNGSPKPDLALAGKPPEIEYPPFKKAAVIMLSLYLTVFLVALDRTIIGTAIPAITDEFHSFDDIGW